MSIGSSPVQDKVASGASGSNTITITGLASVGAGNWGIVRFNYVNTNAIVSSIAQSGAAGTWVQACEDHVNRAVSIWYNPDLTGAGTSNIIITLSANSTSNNISAGFVEWAGLAGGSLDSATTNGAASGTTCATSTLTPAGGRNALLIADLREGGANSGGPTNSYTALASTDGGSRCFAAYLVVASTSGSYDTAWTQGSAAWNTAHACFLAPSGGATSWGPDLSDQLNRLVVGGNN